MVFYQYKAKVEKIIDGDTVIALIDKGFDEYSRKYCRLLGIDAPELNSSDPVERLAAQESKKYLEALVPIGIEIWVDSKKLDPYKRPIVVINLPNQTKSINEQMVAAGHAVPWPKTSTEWNGISEQSKESWLTLLNTPLSKLQNGQT